VEDNRFSISVHYRNVPSDLVDEVECILDTILLEFECSGRADRVNVAPLVKKHGKKVWEIRPAVKWNKGTAVASLLRRMAASTGKGGVARVSTPTSILEEHAPVSTSNLSVANWSNDYIFNEKGNVGPLEDEFCTIFIGDDVTDEDVFGILSVSGQTSHFGMGICVLDSPRPTKATYSLRNVGEVHEFLNHLASL
jgi:trehalose-phosphatase